MGGFSIKWGNQTPNYAERDNNGNLFYSFINALTKNKRFKSDKEKLDFILNNPASLKVLSFIADIGSMVQIEQVKGDTVITDFLKTQSAQPNDWQSWTDFNWDVNFWRAVGKAVVYKDRDIMYVLNPNRMKLTPSQIKSFGQLTFSKYGNNAKRNIKKGVFDYENQNGEVSKLDLKNVFVLSDLSNSINGNWLDAPSRIDALYSVLNNSRLGLDSKAINLEFSQKFLVSGQNDPNDISKTPLTDTEQQSVEKKIRGSKNVHATKTKVNVDHMVDNLAKLKLDESYLHDLAVVANMYGINKDVLAIISKGSTYENYEKSMALYINYTQLPNDKQTTDLYEKIFEVEGLRASYSHLAFNSVFEVEKIENQKTELESLKIAKELGLSDVQVQEKLKEIYQS